MRTTHRLAERYDKLVDALNTSVTSFRLRLVSAQTDETYDRKFHSGELDVAIVEPHRVMEAEPIGYKTIARAGNQDRIAGVIVVPSDTNIRRLKELSGRVIAFPSRTSLASAMLVRMYLRGAGFNLKHAAVVKYVGSQESALISVAMRDADAAGVSRDGWKQFAEQNPYLAGRLEPKWTTEELPGAAVMVHAAFPKSSAAELRRALVGLKHSEEGRAALARAGFTEFRFAEEASYDELWEFLANYARAFPRDEPPSGTQ